MSPSSGGQNRKAPAAGAVTRAAGVQGTPVVSSAPSWWHAALFLLTVDPVLTVGPMLTVDDVLTVDAVLTVECADRGVC